MTTAETNHAAAAATNLPDRRPPVSGMSIGNYLIQRLQDYGVRDVFGIPGDYVLEFYTQLDASPLNTVGCTREDCAGFAADAYARISGIGAVCITYCVGGLSLCNSIAGAYAEKSPVVVISGSPGIRERFNNPLLHHKVKDFHTQFEVFRRLCAAAADLEDPTTAFREIDRVLGEVVRFRRPGYLELPRDMVHVVPEGSYTLTTVGAVSDPDPLAEAVAEATRRISAARRPVIIAGVEIHRFGLQDQLLALAEGAGIPITTDLSSSDWLRRTISRRMVIGSSGRSSKPASEASAQAGKSCGGAFSPASTSPRMKSGSSTPWKWWWLICSNSLVA